MLYGKFLLILLCLAGVTGLAAQTYSTVGTVDSRLKKRYEQAIEYGRAGDLDRALRELDKVLADDPTFVDAHIVRAAVSANRGDYAAAETGYERVLALAPAYEWRVYLELGLVEMKLGKFDEAAAHLRQVADSDAATSRLRQRAADALAELAKTREQWAFAARARANPVPFDPVSLGPNINTEHYEYLPSFTADGRFLVYTTRVNNQEDLYISENIKGAWQPGRPLESINTPLNEAAQSISADGRLLVYAADGRRDGFGGFDLYVAEWENGRWSRPRNIGQPVNSAAWESQPSLSADGQALYFASNRKGTLGGSDIWVSYRQADGRWGTPQNLGPPVNTPQDDESPFVHPDGQTLYFMSKGHPGMGGFDLFVTRRTPDGAWGEPRNLGYPINTEGNEGALVVSLDGRTAYFASDRQGGDDPAAAASRRTTDIFSFELYPAARPAPVTYVQAFVRDAQTGQPLEARVEFTVLASGKVHTAARTGSDGAFLVVLPLGSDYALNVAREGYLFHSENFALADTASIDDPIQMEIELEAIPTGMADATEIKPRPVILRNVFFETASAALLPASRGELDRLAGLLTDNPSLRIQINGHTDDVGSEADNQRLSEARARAVHNYLVQQGIPAERLRYKGFGETMPIAPNDTPEGRRQNRRTEFEVLN